MSVSKVLPIKCNQEGKDFFDKWVEWLKPIHGLTNCEQKLLAAMLRRRHELSKAIIDKELLDRTCLNAENISYIRESMHLSPQQLNGALAGIRNAKVIAPVFKISGRVSYYRISPSIIPAISKDNHTYIVLDFDYENNTAEGDSDTSSKTV